MLVRGMVMCTLLICRRKPHDLVFVGYPHSNFSFSYAYLYVGGSHAIMRGNTWERADKQWQDSKNYLAERHNERIHPSPMIMH